MAGVKVHFNAPKQNFSRHPKQVFVQNSRINGKIQKTPAMNMNTNQRANFNLNLNSRPKPNFKSKFNSKPTNKSSHPYQSSTPAQAPAQNQQQQKSIPVQINTKITGPLFDKNKLQPGWKISRRIGPGLLNGMNTCFLNSVLQCLTYTPPLAQYLLTKSHRSTCKITSFCALCAMEVHINRCLCDPKSLVKGAAIHPKYFTSSLKALSKTMRLGEQEDANEFLMFLFAAFQKSSTYGLGKLDPKVEESTMIHQIFGGRMQSQLRCYNCKATSSNFEAFLDLSIDLHKADTIEQALQNFIKVDIIGGGKDSENKYMCSSCKQRVTAGKQMTLCELPMMLNIHLKRFTFDMQRGYMRKVTTDVKYPEVLDMAPYVSKEKHCQKAIYRLYAVLVHFGGGCSSGHYYAYVKSPEGKWYRMDDEDVALVSLKEVLSQRAYMLFYASEPSTKKDNVPVADEKKLAEKSLKRNADVMEATTASVTALQEEEKKEKEPKRQKIDTMPEDVKIKTEKEKKEEEEVKLARKREKRKEQKEKRKKAKLMEAKSRAETDSAQIVKKNVEKKEAEPITTVPVPSLVSETTTTLITKKDVLVKEPKTDVIPEPISVNSDHPEAWVVRSTDQQQSSLSTYGKKSSEASSSSGSRLRQMINPWVIGTDINVKHNPQKMPKRWHVAQKWTIKET